jgi:3',5'-cyclic AMP phosphodiesterase CpdA
MLIAHVSDPHLTADGAPMHGLVDTGAALARVVAEINLLDPLPDAALVTGDLTHEGEAGAAARAAAILSALRMPWFAVPGNHDRRAAVRVACGPYPGDAAADWMAYAVEGFPLRLLALDATTDDPFRARLPRAELAWLAARLAEAPERPTLVFLHHPPFDTGIGWLDQMGIAEGRHEMGKMLRAHGCVVAVLCGHLHHPMRGTWYGVPVLAGPSAANRTVTSGHGTELAAIAVAAPPGYALHRWDETAKTFASELRFLDGHAEGWRTARPDPSP